MKQIIKLTENDLTLIIKKIIQEENRSNGYDIVVSIDDLLGDTRPKNIRDTVLTRLSDLCNETDGKVYFTKTLTINDNDPYFFKNLYKTDGLLIKDTNFNSIPNLEVVSGDVVVYTPITNFGNLKRIEGNFRYEGSHSDIARSNYNRYRNTGEYSYYEEYFKNIFTCKQTGNHSYDFFNNGKFIASIEILGKVW